MIGEERENVWGELKRGVEVEGVVGGYGRGVRRMGGGLIVGGKG